MEEPEVQQGPITDKSRMLAPPPGSISQPIPRVQAPPVSDMPPPMAARDDASRSGSRRLVAWGVLIALVSGATLVGFSQRREIATLFPPAASFYAWLGAPVNIRGFELKARQTQELANGVPVIAIKGEIINVTDRELPVPSLVLRVLDTNKRELYRWVVPPEQPRLAGHQKQNFTAKLESPPPDTADIEIRFAKPDG